MINIILGIVLILLSIYFTIRAFKSRIKHGDFFDKCINFKGFIVGILVFIAGLLFTFQKVNILDLF